MTTIDFSVSAEPSSKGFKFAIYVGERKTPVYKGQYFSIKPGEVPDDLFQEFEGGEDLENGYLGFRVSRSYHMSGKHILILRNNEEVGPIIEGRVIPYTIEFFSQYCYFSNCWW